MERLQLSSDFLLQSNVSWGVWPLLPQLQVYFMVRLWYCPITAGFYQAGDSQSGFLCLSRLCSSAAWPSRCPHHWTLHCSPSASRRTSPRRWHTLNTQKTDNSWNSSSSIAMATQSSTCCWGLRDLLSEQRTSGINSFHTWPTELSSLVSSDGSWSASWTGLFLILKTFRWLRLIQFV